MDHGTVTAVVNGTPFEVTTLRRDVETTGRHARVAFTEPRLVLRDLVDVVHLPVVDAAEPRRLVPRAATLRVFACATPNGYVVMPGGLTRVTSAAGDGKTIVALGYVRVEVPTEAELSLGERGVHRHDEAGPGHRGTGQLVVGEVVRDVGAEQHEPGRPGERRRAGWWGGIARLRRGTGPGGGVAFQLVAERGGERAFVAGGGSEAIEAYLNPKFVSQAGL